MYNMSFDKYNFRITYFNISMKEDLIKSKLKKFLHWTIRSSFQFITGFFNTDCPSDFVPMAFVIYTCVLSSIDEERLVEAENKKKKRKRRKEIEERKVKLCRGSVIERFCFCSRSFFSLFRSMLFTVSTIEPVGNWSGRIEENFHDPLQLDDVPLFSFFFQEYVYSNCIVFFKKRFDFSSKRCWENSS